MTKHVIVIAALSTLMACAAAAQSEPSPESFAAAAPALVRCDIRITSSDGVVRIEALASATQAVSGAYELVVSKDGPGGSSEIVQGGPFEAGEDAEVSLSASEFGVDRGDSYRARLALNGADGPLCNAERQL